MSAEGWGPVQLQVLTMNVTNLDQLMRIAGKYSYGRGAGARAFESVDAHLTSGSGTDAGSLIPGTAGHAIGSVLAEHPSYGSGNPPPVVKTFTGADGAAGALDAANLYVTGAIAGIGSGAGPEYFDGLLQVVFGGDALSGMLRDVLGGDPLGDDVFTRLPPDLKDLEEIGKRTCLLGLGHAVNDWAREAAGSVGTAWATGITGLTPPSGCAGTHVTITGSGFGATRPPEVDIAFASDNGCVVATVVSWSDTAVEVVAPPRVSRGCVGFVQWGKRGAGLAQAASNVAGQMVECLGPAVTVAANRIEELGGRSLTPCPPCLPGRVNYFEGGAPTINYFQVNGGDAVTIGNNDDVTLAWSVNGADQIAIVAIQDAAGTSQIPDLNPATLLNPVSGSADVYSLTADHPWDAQYELRATNGCSRRFAFTSRRVTVHMRARSRLSVLGIEVNQSTQFHRSSRHILNSSTWRTDNSVPLIASKPTIARVFAGSGGDTLFDAGRIRGVTARLHGTDSAGNPLPGSPLFPLSSAGVPVAGLSIVAHLAAAAPGTVAAERTWPTSESFTFLLPASWTTARSIDLRAQLFPPADVIADAPSTSLTQTVTFRTGGLPLRFAVLPVGYVEPGTGNTAAPPNLFQRTAELDQLQRMYPSRRGLVSAIPAPGTNPYTYTGNLAAGGVSCGQGWNDLLIEMAGRAFFTTGFEDRIWVALLDLPAITASGATVPSVTGCGAPMSSLALVPILGTALGAILFGPFGALALYRLGTCALGLAASFISAPPSAPAMGGATRVGTLAQEVGHGFGLFHVPGGTAAPPYEGGWPNYENGVTTAPDGTSDLSGLFQSIGEFGVDIDDFLGTPPRLRSFSPRSFTGGSSISTDFMGYVGSTDWTSPYTYLRLMAGTTVPPPPPPSGPLPPAAAPAGAAPQAHPDRAPDHGVPADESHDHHIGKIIFESEKPVATLLLRGSIDSAGAHVLPLYTTMRPLRLQDLDDTPYRAELRDANGKMLAGNGLVPLAEQHTAVEPPFGFLLVLPWNDRARRLVIVRDGQEMTGVDIPVAAPKISQPDVAIADGTAVIRWRADHADGKSLRYLVRAATDESRQWRFVACDLATPECRVPVASLPASPTCILQIAASVGGRTVWTESKPFVVPASPPELALIAPADGTQVAANTAISLRAEAMSVTTGTLEDSSLRWHSSLDGELGSGRALSVVLKPGRHIITLSALAPDGGEARAAAHVSVGARIPKI